MSLAVATSLLLGFLLAAVAGAFHRTDAAARRSLRAAGRLAPAREGPPLSVLLPVRGADQFTAAVFRSWTEQHYPEDVQVIFAFQDPGDPALAHARAALRRVGMSGSDRRPGPAAQVVVGPVRPGHTGKVSNLRNGLELARHRHLVLSDADVVADPHTCARLAARFRQGADLVSCLPRLTRAGNLWGRVYAALWNQTILGFVAPTILREGRGAIGASLGITRPALDRLGGLAPFRDRISDDVAMGRQAAELGLRARLGPTVEVPVGRMALRELFHKLSRAALMGIHRSPVEDNLRFFASYAYLPTLVLAGVVRGAAAPGLALLLMALRIWLASRLHRLATGRRRVSWEVVPGDLLFLAAYAWALVRPQTVWGGIRYRVGRDGRATVPED